MPLFYQHTINQNTCLAVWKIEETEAFFLEKVPVPPTITNPHKRLQHLAGRWLLQYLFAGFPYGEILIADTKKPYLPAEQYHFSISHCNDYAAAIVSKTRRVGIDVEVPTYKVEKIKHKFLHCDELQEADKKIMEYDANNNSIPYQYLTLLWSAKEAVFKWWSYGSVDFSEHIRLAPFRPATAGNDRC